METGAKGFDPCMMQLFTVRDENIQVTNLIKDVLTAVLSYHGSVGPKAVVVLTKISSIFSRLLEIYDGRGDRAAAKKLSKVLKSDEFYGDLADCVSALLPFRGLQ